METRPHTDALQLTSHNAAASGGDSVITLTAASTTDWIVIESVSFSYAGTPTSGLLSIVDSDSAVKWRQYVTAGGVGHLDFGEDGLVIDQGNNVTITLDDGTQAKHLDVKYK